MKTDEEIKKKVTDEIYWDARVDASDIKVEVEDGKVKLSGDIPTYSGKLAAENDVWSISGVNSIENNIKVNLPKVPTDKDIKANIDNVFTWNPSIDETDIEVSVTGGFVEIEGSVDAYWKKHRVEELASDVEGILGVSNKLSIVPTKDYVDKDIAKDIVSAMIRNLNVDAEEVNVKVKNGKVTLSGTVSSWNAWRSAYNSAAYTAGVVEVEDNLVISE